MGGSTPRATSLRVAGAVAAAALAIAGLTALVFLIRAGGDPADAATWPITWELRSSDNGPLFQLLQDVVAGRPLDWSFSPQVFVFPELPISVIAFAVSGGSIWAYYLVVAILNNVLLFLVLLGLARVLFRDARWTDTVLRAVVATVPLLALPLIGTSWILSFHLAPTYYIGMYAALLAAPLLMLVESWPARISISIALALTAASNPLALVFVAPGTAIALVLFVIRRGSRAARRPVVLVAGSLILTLLLRLAFSPLEGTSPFTYVDADVFASRLSQIGPYFAFHAQDSAMAVILALGIGLAVACFAAAIVVTVMYFQRRGQGDSRHLAVVYLGIVPLGGLSATYALMITHYLYFWPVLILPFVLVLLAIPRNGLRLCAAAGAIAFLAFAMMTGLTSNLGVVERYFEYRSEETICLDSAAAAQVGYATFSDSRRVSLTSQTGLRLIQIESNGEPSHWLTNRAYATSEAGTFFYVNRAGDEPALDTGSLAERFGEPDRVWTCSEDREVWLYRDDDKRELISEFYGVSP